MSFAPLALRWTSLVPDTPSPGDALPALLATPATPWDYGAGTDPVATDWEDAVIRLTLRCDAGSVGLSVMSANYGAQLTREAHLMAQGGKQTAIFALPSRLGPSRLVARTYGDEPSAGRLVVLGVEIGRRSDLSEAEAGAVLETGTASAPLLTDDIAAWAPTRAERFQPLSLGNTCEAKFQIARVLQFRRDPDSSEMAFRLALLPPRRSKHRFGWELFDWQGTSLKAVQHYLEHDFHGLFEREDLAVESEAVLHRNLRTFHEHDFEVLLDDPRAKVTEEVIDRGYPAVRARFDAMVARFRATLHTPGPYLYVHVCEDIPTDWDVQRLVTALRALSQDHRFRLLFVGYEDSDTPWGDYAHKVADKAFRPRAWNKPEGRSWEGPDEAWSAALAPYTLLFPDGSVAEPLST